jgi:hypothetical protein
MQTTIAMSYLQHPDVIHRPDLIHQLIKEDKPLSKYNQPSIMIFHLHYKLQQDMQQVHKHRCVDNRTPKA